MENLQPVVTDADCMLVAELAEKIWKAHFTPIVGLAQVDYMLEKFQSPAAVAQQVASGIRYYLLASQGQPMGYIGYEHTPSGLFLSKFYLLEIARGKGLGKQALAFLAAEARQGTPQRIYLYVNKYNTGTINAYLAMGFRESGERVVDIGGGFVMDDFIMEKNVAIGDDAR